jgi:hypothetical protein
MIGIGLNINNRVVGGFDSSASAFFTATGITGTTEQQAVNTLVTSLKSAGLWSKMKAVYPFVTDNRNLLSYTEAFDNATWSKGSSTVTANATTAPNGTLTADAIIPTVGSDNQHNIFQSLSLQSGQSYTFSASLKAFGYTYAMLSIYDGSFKYVIFDLTNGVVTNSASGTTYTISSQGDGWYRCSVSITSSGTITGFNYIGPVPTSNFVQPTSWTANGTSGIYGWGAQTNLGSTATTYQPIATTQQSYISNQFKYNLVNPVDSDAAFRGVFNGGWTFSNNGATPNGTNGYMDTKLNPLSASISATSMHISTYLRTNNDGVYCDMGAYDGNPANYQISTYARITNICYVDLGAQLQTRQTYSNTDSSGYYIASRTANNVLKAFKNNTLKATNTNTNTASMLSKNIFISANNDTGSAITQFSNRQTAFSSIGDGLTDTEATALYNAVQTFQTSLSRQV